MYRTWTIFGLTLTKFTAIVKCLFKCQNKLKTAWTIAENGQKLSNV